MLESSTCSGSNTSKDTLDRNRSRPDEISVDSFGTGSQWPHGEAEIFY
jgi:hypothetical protein